MEKEKNHSISKDSSGIILGNPHKSNPEADFSKSDSYMNRHQMKLFVRVWHSVSSFVTKNQTILISFFTAVALMQIAYAIKGIYPYGSKSVLIIDLFHQYAPFLAELQYKLKNFESLLYTWSGGLGNNFYGTMSYYHASPLNLLALLFPSTMLTELVLTLTLLKVGLAAAFFCIWLRGEYEKDDYGAIAFSLMYALSGYVLAFSWNIMWLDGIMLLPLAALGLSRLIRYGNAVMYTTSMAIMLFSNFYISFFSVLFLILYFPFLLMKHLEAPTIKMLMKRLFQFTVFSLLALGLAAIMILPTIEVMRHTSAVGEKFPETVLPYFDLFDYIARHFELATPNNRSGLANIYCGISVFLLIPLFFLGKGASGKGKIYLLFLLVFMILGFNLNVLNFIWHGLHFPNQVPYRNAYVYVFLVLSIAYPALLRIRKYRGWQVGILGLVSFLIVLFAQKTMEPKLEFLDVYLTLLFILVYMWILTSKQFDRQTFFTREFVFFVIVVLELGLNTTLVVDKLDKLEYYAARDGYATGNDADSLISTIETLNREDQGFYRMEVYPPKTPNDPFLYHYNGFSIFSSMSSEKIAKTMFRYGYHGNDINSYKYEGSTPVMDAVFGIKYLIRRTGPDNEFMKKQIHQYGDIRVFKNPDALSIGFWTPPETAVWSSLGKKAMDAQNSMMETFTGTSDIFRPVAVTSQESTNSTILTKDSNEYEVLYPDKNAQAIIKMYIDVDHDMELYVHYDASPPQFGIGNVFIGDKKMPFDSIRSTLLGIGHVTKGTRVTIELWPNSRASGEYRFKLYPYELDQSRFSRAVSTLRVNELQIDEFNDTSIKAKVTNKQDGTIFTSIPYDEGWTVWVDGKRTPAIAIDGAFLGFHVFSGEHQVKLSFMPKYFMLGMEISFFCLLYLLLALLRKHRFLIGDVPLENDNGIVEEEVGNDLTSHLSTKEVDIKAV